jgi:hypothetical protein
MAKINGNTIKPGMVLQHENGLWVCVKAAHVKPGKGGAFAQVELKNLIDGRKLNERFRSDDKVERDHAQPDSQFRRRRVVAGVVLVVGGGQLGGRDDVVESLLEVVDLALQTQHFHFRHRTARYHRLGHAKLLLGEFKIAFQGGG